MFYLVIHLWWAFGLFHLLVAVNSAVINIGCTSICFGFLCVRERELAGSHGSCVFDFLKNCQTIFILATLFSISARNSQGSQCLHIPNTCRFAVLKHSYPGMCGEVCHCVRSVFLWRLMHSFFSCASSLKKCLFQFLVNFLIVWALLTFFSRFLWLLETSRICMYEYIHHWGSSFPLLWNIEHCFG